jgi:hypothetical protein
VWASLAFIALVAWLATARSLIDDRTEFIAAAVGGVAVFVLVLAPGMVLLLLFGQLAAAIGAFLSYRVEQDWAADDEGRRPTTREGA